VRLPPLNPVLARELKQRMRGRLTWLVLTAYLGLLALILRVVMAGVARFSGAELGNPFASAAVGRSVFGWLLFFMLILVCFIVPGLTAAAISSERERRTLTSLQVTLLPARSIVLGKILASLSFVLLLVVASVPLLSVPFLVGGVSLGEMVRGVTMVLVAAVTIGCIGVAVSTSLRRTQAATVVTYGLTLFLVLGTLMVYGAQRAFDRSERMSSPAVLALNPFVATADVVRGRQGPFDGLPSPFSALQALLDSHTVQPDVAVASDQPGQLVAPDGPAPEPEAPARVKVAGLPFWAASLAMSGLLAAGAFALAVRRITLPTTRERAG